MHDKKIRVQDIQNTKRNFKYTPSEVDLFLSPMTFINTTKPNKFSMNFFDAQNPIYL